MTTSLVHVAMTRCVSDSAKPRCFLQAFMDARMPHAVSATWLIDLLRSSDRKSSCGMSSKRRCRQSFRWRTWQAKRKIEMMALMAFSRGTLPKWWNFSGDILLNLDWYGSGNGMGQSIVSISSPSGEYIYVSWLIYSWGFCPIPLFLRGSCTLFQLSHVLLKFHRPRCSGFSWVVDAVKACECCFWFHTSLYHGHDGDEKQVPGFLSVRTTQKKLLVVPIEIRLQTLL